MITIEAKDGKVNAIIEGTIDEIMCDGVSAICSLVEHVSEVDKTAGMVIKRIVMKDFLTGEISARATHEIKEYEQTDFSLLKAILDKMNGGNNDNS